MRGYCQQAARVEDCGSYRRSQRMAALDDKAVAQARVEFRKYRLDGVIPEGDFDMDEWHLYDEIRNYRFDFGIDGETYEEGAGRWTGLPCESFKERMKAYVVLRMGSYSLETLRITVINLREIAAAGLDGLGRMPGKRIQAQAIDFLVLAGRGGTDLDDAVEMLEEKYNAASFQPARSRELAGFGDYFTFDREQKNYWENADREEKAGAFPVWLWWNLTAILPLRPTEFLTMPWDCLGKYGDGYVLTVRRTLQKKGTHRYRYHVADDYGLYSYHIPEKLADEIRRYREWTEPLREAGDWGLLLPSHKSGLGYMAYGELKDALAAFLHRIGQQGLSIRLGDTRHLAMISLILSGGSPEVCRELAGHEDIDISSNYYANISTLIESAVYDRSRHSGNTVMFEGMAAAPAVCPDDVVETNGGWCDYPPAWEGDVSECMKSYRGRGRLGECLDCAHFHAGNAGLRLKIREHHKDNVSDDAAFLVQAVDAVRRSRGQEEAIDAAIVRLQASGRAYASCLWQELREGDHGKAQKE